MIIDGVRSRLVAGDTVHIPADVVHAGGNVGATRGQRIVLFSPGGMENFFREVGTSAEDEIIEPRFALAAANRHGRRFTGD